MSYFYIKTFRKSSEIVNAFQIVLNSNDQNKCQSCLIIAKQSNLELIKEENGKFEKLGEIQLFSSLQFAGCIRSLHYSISDLIFLINSKNEFTIAKIVLKVKTKPYLESVYDGSFPLTHKIMKSFIVQKSIENSKSFIYIGSYSEQTLQYLYFYLEDGKISQFKQESFNFKFNVKYVKPLFESYLENIDDNQLTFNHDSYFNLIGVIYENQKQQLFEIHSLNIKDFCHKNFKYQNWKIKIPIKKIYSIQSLESGNILIFTQNEISLYLPFQNQPIFQKNINIDTDVIKEYQKNKFLVSDSKNGDIYSVIIDVNNKIFVKYMGKFNNCQVIQNIRDDYIFLGSNKNNSQIVQLLNQPIQLSVTTFSFLSKVYEFQNISYIQDIQLAQTQNENYIALLNQQSGFNKFQMVQLSQKQFEIKFQQNIKDFFIIFDNYIVVTFTKFSLLFIQNNNQFINIENSDLQQFKYLKQINNDQFLIVDDNSIKIFDRDLQQLNQMKFQNEILNQQLNDDILDIAFIDNIQTFKIVQNRLVQQFQLNVNDEVISMSRENDLLIVSFWFKDEIILYRNDQIQQVFKIRPNVRNIVFHKNYIIFGDQLGKLYLYKKYEQYVLVNEMMINESIYNLEKENLIIYGNQIIKLSINNNDNFQKKFLNYKNIKMIYQFKNKFIFVKQNEIFFGDLNEEITDTLDSYKIGKQVYLDVQNIQINKDLLYISQNCNNLANNDYSQLSVYSESSYLKICDQVFKNQKIVSFEVNEQIIIATNKQMNESQIYLYQFQSNKFKQLYSLSKDNYIIGIKFIQKNQFLAVYDQQMIIYEIDDQNQIYQITKKNMNYIIIDFSIQNEFIVLADHFKNILLYKYEESKINLIAINQDLSKIINVEIQNKIIYSTDLYGNILMLKHGNNNQTLQKLQLQLITGINVGSPITCLNKNQIQLKDSQIDILNLEQLVNSIIYGTKNGQMGLILEINQSLFEKLIKIQNQIINKEYFDYRKIKNQNIQGQQNMIDGDVLCLFKNFTQDLQKEIDHQYQDIIQIINQLENILFF